MRKELSPALVVAVVVLVLAAVGGIMWWRSSHIGDGKQSGGFAQNEKLRAAIGQKYRQEVGSTGNAGDVQPADSATNQQPADNGGQARPMNLRPGGRNLRRGD